MFYFLEDFVVITTSDRFALAVEKKKSILVCGLDPQVNLIPLHLRREVKRRCIVGDRFERTAELVFEFNCEVLDVVHDFAVAVKLNLAFYEQLGHSGIWAFQRTLEQARAYNLLIIGDGKRNDGGDTADAYANGYLGKMPVLGDDCEIELVSSPMNVDALTVTPYIGDACVCPFVGRVKEFGKAIFCVTKTSFKPNSHVEQLPVEHSGQVGGAKVWEMVARKVAQWGEGTEGACGLTNVGAVMGATYPEDAPKMREILPKAWLLIPGYGKQGGGAAGAVAGVRPDGLGGLVNSSRGVANAYLDKDGNLKCKPEQCFDLVRAAAKDSCDELVAACRAAGKWPF